MAVAGAEEMGARLLGEVDEGELIDILSLLRHQRITSTSNSNANTQPTPYPYSTLPFLDRLLTSPPNQHHQQTQPPQPPIIELTSISPSTGTTSLLNHTIATTILPSAYGGKGAAAIHLDTDGRFDISRLPETCKSIILNSRRPKQKHPQNDASASAPLHAGPNTNPAGHADAGTVPDMDVEVDVITRKALNHLHIFRPTSYASLLATLHALPGYLFADQGQAGNLLSAYTHNSGDRAVSLLVLDSASAFFWPERLRREDREREREEDDEEGEDEVVHVGERDKDELKEQSEQSLATALRKVQRLLDCMVVYTSHTLSSSLTNTTSSALPSPLNPTLKLLLHRKAVNRFPVGMSLEGAMRDREMRQGVVERGEWEVVVVGGSVVGSAVGMSGAGRGSGRLGERVRFWVRGRGGVVWEGHGED